MTKKKNDKLDRGSDGLNNLSRLMLKQNDSLRKLLEELSTKEKEINRKNKNQFNNLKE